MTTVSPHLLSIVLPVHDEQAGIGQFHETLTHELNNLKSYTFEIIYCDDGSQDGSLAALQKLADTDKRIRVIRLSRNFGKEIATTAGFRAARGEAIITLDSDGQHPVELIKDFVAKWESGAKVVIGLRKTNQGEGIIKRWGSRLFYGIFKRLTGIKIVPKATDFRLIDRRVQSDFNRLTEHNRITRGLIDWLGYDQQYIDFEAKPRLHDSPAYSFTKLLKLAVDSAISLSISPLYVTAYIGVLVFPLSVLLALVMVVDKLCGDPLHWHTTGGAYVSVLVLCLIGILLLSQGVIGLYLSHIHSETQNRPLYIVDEEASRRL